jgi:hypothetical protein
MAFIHPEPSIQNSLGSVFYPEMKYEYEILEIEGMVAMGGLEPPTPAL